MKTIFPLFFCFFIIACDSLTDKSKNIELITESSKQDSIFQALLSITQNSIQTSDLSDSLAFLILPIQASCPSCRKKTIDSIVKHQENLITNHYIIISSYGGRKSTRGYFREQGYELPDIPGIFFLDSNNLAGKLQLYQEKPTIYYAHNRKTYKKVAAIPSTVKDDLQEFFSGCRQADHQ